MQMKNTLQKALTQLGYTSFYPIQEKCFPILDSGKSLYAQAETGSGKTLAYLLPALNNIDESFKDIQVLIIAPTRELALQIGSNVEKLTVFTNIHTVTCIGGIDIRKQENQLRHKPQIAIGTPGRILDLMDQEMIHFDCVKMIILDEADQVIATGQRNETERILTGHECQMAVFSATLNQDVKSFIPTEQVEEVILNPTKLNHKITSYYYPCDSKFNGLKQILKHTAITSGIIFVNHRSDALDLAKRLQDMHYRAAAFSAQFDERKRISIIKQFKTGQLRLLVATDAAARGLDLPELSHIIHYDIPIDEETYIHRSGRTAHQNNEGITITLIDGKEENEILSNKIQKQSEKYIFDTEVHSDLHKKIVKEKGNTTDVTKILIRAGRKDKIRPGDIIGALCTVLPFEEIGKLEIQDRYSTVVILKKDRNIIKKLDGISIKGKKRKIELYREEDF